MLKTEMSVQIQSYNFIFEKVTSKIYHFGLSKQKYTVVSLVDSLRREVDSLFGKVNQNMPEKAKVAVYQVTSNLLSK